MCVVYYKGMQKGKEPPLGGSTMNKLQQCLQNGSSTSLGSDGTPYLSAMW